MNREFFYLIAEALYLKTTNHPLCNRNWLFAIYKSLLVTNVNDTEQMIWTPYNQWKIDHNCRAAKSTATKNLSKIEQLTIDRINEHENRIRVIFSKNGILNTPLTCMFSKDGFPSDLWTFRNPQHESVLLSSYECDELYHSCLNTFEIEEEVEEPLNHVLVDTKKETNKKTSKKKKEINPSTQKRSEEHIRNMKFTALHNLVEHMRGIYVETTDPHQRSFLEVVLGAAIFYLPSLHAHFNGYISVNALKGFLRKERKVKDHIYPRKLAARELLANPMTLEDLKNRYHDHLATYMYITSEENGLLVNYYEDHENHDLAMEALQIEKFPTNAAEKFSSHRELDNFLKDLNPRKTQNLSAEDLMRTLRAFRLRN